MPIFQSRREPAPEPVAEPEPAPKKLGLFHSRRDAEPARTPSTATSSSGRSDGAPPAAGSSLHSKRGGLFRRSHDADTTPTSPAAAHTASATAEDDAQRKPNLLHKGLNRMGFGSGGDDDGALDPSILRAREHVLNAEAAEEEADRALDEAKRRVREAREHARRLEEEAAEDARRAKIKQHHAAEVTKRGKVLGRHGL